MPEIAEVASGRKIFKILGKSLGRQTPRKQLVSGSGKELRAESFQRNLQNESEGREETILQTFLIIHVE